MHPLRIAERTNATAGIAAPFGLCKPRPMLRKIYTPTLAAMSVLITGLSTTPAHAQRMVAIGHGAEIGVLDANASGRDITIDFKARDNGRGPTIKETIVLGADGLPVSWEVNSQSLTGAPILESMTRADGTLSWQGSADSGSVKGVDLYLSSTASPWALGLYARAALASPDHVIETAPEGQLRATPFDAFGLKECGAPVSARVVRLEGLWMEPRYAVLADDDSLLAASGGSNPFVIREDIKGCAKVVRDRIDQLSLDRLFDLASRLSHKTDGPIQIRNVHIFDPRSGTVGPLQVVSIYRGKITSVVADTPRNRETSEDAVLIDGEGGTLIPGLRDMHSHTSLESGLFNIAAGVTSSRDMGNDPGFIAKYLPMFDSGELIGPRVTPNGFIEGKSPYSSNNGRLAHDVDEALEHVKWYADHGFWQIKIYNSVHPDWVKPMTDRAHELGMRVTGHVPAFMNADQAITNGYDEIAHINQLMLGWTLSPDEDTRTTLRMTGLNRLADVDLDSDKVQHTLALMRSHGTALDTTISTQERIALSRSGTSQRGELAYLDHVPIDYQRFRKRDIVPTSSRAEEKGYEDAVDRMVELIGRLHQQGTTLLPGTDDGYGFPNHRELELYVMAGLTPAEALRASVYDSAAYMKQGETLGLIERGMLADMVLLPGDPTTDISMIRHGRLVMRGGVIFFPDEIYTALSIKPFSTRPSISWPSRTAEIPAEIRIENHEHAFD